MLLPSYALIHIIIIEFQANAIVLLLGLLLQKDWLKPVFRWQGPVELPEEQFDYPHFSKKMEKKFKEGVVDFVVLWYNI